MRRLILAPALLLSLLGCNQARVDDLESQVADLQAATTTHHLWTLLDERVITVDSVPPAMSMDHLGNSRPRLAMSIPSIRVRRAAQ